MIFTIFLFLVLSSGVIFLRPRSSLFCFLLLANVGIAGWQASNNTSTIAIDTLIKAVLLPICLMLKLRTPWVRWSEWSISSKLWLWLVVYVLIAGMWSPNKIAAIKMVAYLLCYACLFPTFTVAWKRQWLTPSILLVNVWVVLLIAVLQTYFVGNPFGWLEDRFTSFTSPQYFAAYLACILAILLWSQLPTLIAWGTTTAICIGIVLSGSRYVLLGTIALLGIFWMSRSQHQTIGSRMRTATAGLLAVGVVGWVVTTYLPDSRLHQLVDVYSEGTLSPVGTFMWRVAIYQEVIGQLSDRWLSNSPELVFGSGTSSGPAVLSGLTSRFWEVEDANRTIHNEFLRSLYEWGVVGALLLSGFVISALWPYLNSLRNGSLAPALVILAILPTLLLGLLFENVLAGPVAGGGTGYLLALSYGSAFLQVSTRSRRELDAG